nr:diguanylate cyclase [uncultured Anaerobutyricum sp.]
MKGRKIETVCIVAVLVLLFLLTGRLYQSETDKSTFCSLNSGWYQIKDGKKIHVELPCYVVTDANGKIVLYNDTLSEKDQGKFISSKGVQDHLEIDLGDGILYQYKKHQFQKNKQMKGKIWAEICLPEGTGEKTLRFMFEGEKNSSLYIQAPVMGSFPEIVKSHLQESVFSILMIIGMLGMGIVSVIIFIYTSHRRIVEKRFLNVAAFLFLCSLWSILDSEMYQMYGRQNEIGTQISFYAFMLMSIPMLYFVQNTVSRDVRWVPKVWIFLLYGDAILQGVINSLFGIPFIHMLFVTQLILMTGVTAMIFLLWKEYQKRQTQELKFCLRAFTVLGISGMAAIVLYWMFAIYWYDAIFQFGILLYISFLFGGLLFKVSNDIEFHLEQTVYERLSVEDRMTGVKNRKAFEQCIEEIQEAAILLKNALLLFIHIDGLKKINDMNGMQMGDEVVIRTARSIQIAGKSLEPDAESFRVNGNEFAVVAVNPQKLPEEWEKVILNELKKEIGSRCRIELKFGYSYLREKDGTLQSVSDWKMQADKMLCLNTGKSVEDRYDL